MMQPTRLVVTVAALLVASACALTAIALSDGQPQPLRYRWSQATYAPKPGSVRIEARAKDPGGDAPWVVRVWITRDNMQACEQLGREVDGVIGDTGLDGRFRPLKFGERTLCSPRVLDQDEPLVLRSRRSWTTRSRTTPSRSAPSLGGSRDHARRT